MARKHEKFKRLSFLTPVDDWIDGRKKEEGAEGLWRIHDKLYDFTIWSKTHPGGKFWIDVTRGTDITEVFESHHLSDKAESVLHKYYRREAAKPRNYLATFREDGFYKVFKRRVSQEELMTAEEDSLAVQLTSDCLAVAVFLTGLLGIRIGIFWAITSGVLLGLLSVASHSFFHSKENWRIYYFDLSLMSSRDWKIRHVLSHHSFRNTVSDLEIPVWKPFLENYGKYIRLTANAIVFFVAAHVQFVQRCLSVLLSKKLGFNVEELIWFSFPLFMFLCGGKGLWEVFVVWNIIVMTSSFCFCLFSSNFFMYSIQTNAKEFREKQDFGIIQLSLVGNNLKENNVLSFLNSFRGNVLHYLCPRINCKCLQQLIPAFEESIQELGISLVEKSTGYLDDFENKMPKGYTFFS